jgi:ureidoglycolate lyase
MAIMWSLPMRRPGAEVGDVAREWRIGVTDLTEAAFAPYGRIVALPTTPALRSGPGWECWYGFQTLDCRWPLAMGAVVTRRRAIVVDAMERHTHTFELLHPHGHPLIQPLALPRDLDDPRAQPDPATVKAFRIPVGVGIIMHPGTWHSAAFPESEDCTYSFACMEPDFAYVPEWVPFPGGDTVQVSDS